MEAYGGDPALRAWLEGRGLWHVLAVKCTELVAVAGPAGPVRMAAEQLAAGVLAEEWVGCSAGDGAKGRRLYDWTGVELTAPAAAGMGRWLLVRRSRADGELAFYACYGPAVTPLVGLVRVAGSRWAVEEGFEQAKGEVGLDTTRCAGGRAGIGMSPWRCWRTRFWPSPAPRRSAARGQRGPWRLERRARAAAADGA
jgi:hypothetical protein